MIDWSARIDDLMHLLGVQHAVSDRLAVEVLLSALIECPQTCEAWMILETPWHEYRFDNAWFGLGGAWQPISLKRMRGRSGNDAREELDRWMDHPIEPRLFVDSDYDRYIGCPCLSQAPLILLRTLRIRTRAARNANALRTLDLRVRQREYNEVAISVKSILKDRVGARPPDPPKFVQPPWFLFYAELLQRLSPWYIDWRVLLIALAGITIRHAYLHGLTETGLQQNVILARVAADSVPPWIAHALRYLLEKGSASSQQIAQVMGLQTRDKKSKYGPLRELGRLRQNGIIDIGQNRGWFIIGEFREGVEFLLTGRAFGMLASCA